MADLIPILPIKRVITNDQRFMGLFCPSPMFHLLCFQKPVLSYTFTFFLACSVFEAISLNLPICLFATFFFLCQITPTPFPQILSAIKTFLNIRTVPSSAVFCSNAVFIKTPSSSMYFFSFFDVLLSAPTTTGMTLMLLMFHILLISVFSSWYLNFLFLFFTNSYVSRYSNINYGTTSLI